MTTLRKSAEHLKRRGYTEIRIGFFKVTAVSPDGSQVRFWTRGGLRTYETLVQVLFFLAGVLAERLS